jgi:hypothetical protein
MSTPQHRKPGSATKARTNARQETSFERTAEMR